MATISALALVLLPGAAPANADGNFQIVGNPDATSVTLTAAPGQLAANEPVYWEIDWSWGGVMASGYVQTDSQGAFSVRHDLGFFACSYFATAFAVEQIAGARSNTASIDYYGDPTCGGGS